MAMEARCYHGGEGRTHFHVLRFQRADFIALAVLCLLYGRHDCRRHADLAPAAYAGTAVKGGWTA